MRPRVQTPIPQSKINFKKLEIKGKQACHGGRKPELPALILSQIRKGS
jgi:hypothetical protein